jgi:hypothetical protein
MAWPAYCQCLFRVPALCPTRRSDRQQGARNFDMDMSYARRVPHPKVLHQRTASYSSHTSHSVSHVLHQRTASHSSISYILHLTSYVLRLTSYTLRLTSYALRLTSYTLRLTSYIISYHILYRVTCIRLVCKTYPWSDASTIRQKL